MSVPKEIIHINYADVVMQGRREDPRFLARYYAMQEKSSDREFGRKVCLHEAAHAVYMENDGIQNVRFLGPAILYIFASR